MNYFFEYPMEVRDYECDLQGIVNNSVYQNYLEHTRHQFLRSVGESFKEMHNRGVDAVVRRVEIDYKVSLRSEDTFICRLAITREGAKFVFHQQILRQPDLKLCIQARIESVCIDNGRVSRGDEIAKCFEPYFSIQ